MGFFGQYLTVCAKSPEALQIGQTYVRSFGHKTLPKLSLTEWDFTTASGSLLLSQNTQCFAET